MNARIILIIPFLFIVVSNQAFADTVRAVVRIDGSQITGPVFVPPPVIVAPPQQTLETAQNLKPITPQLTIQMPAQDVQKIIDKAFGSSAPADKVINAAIASVFEKMLSDNKSSVTEKSITATVQDMRAVVGAAVLTQAAVAPQKAAVMAQTVSKIIQGEPVNRQEVSKQFPALGKALLEQEQKTMKDGIFQKLFGRNPVSSADWNIVQQVAYRENGVQKNSTPATQSSAQKKYEVVFHVKLSTLQASKSAQSQEQYRQAVRVINILASHGTHSNTPKK